MNYVSITGITLGVAVVAVLVIGLLSYLSQLVKNAYQIKVEIRSDMENGLKKIEDDLAKKAKWMRSEVGEDITKIKQAIEQDSLSRLQAIEDRLTSLAQDLDEGSRTERSDMRNTINQLRKRLSAAEQEIASLKEDAARRAAITQRRRSDERSRDDDEPLTVASPGDSDNSVSVAEGSHSPDTFTPTSPMSLSGSSPHPHTSETTGNSVIRSGGVQRIQLQDFAEKR